MMDAKTSRTFLFGMLAALLSLLPTSLGVQAWGQEATSELRMAKSSTSVTATSVTSANTWIDHYRDDLLPYYMTSDALGTPVGNFPTFRCDNGRVFDPANPCIAFAQIDSPSWSWIKEGVGRDYVRIKSRQVYFYAVGYHLTGDEKLLVLAKKGLDFIRANMFDSEGIPYSFSVDGGGQPLKLQRTSQDLAYALNGFAFYYYLTRDAETLEDLLRIKDHVFDHYYDSSRDMIRWVAEESPDTRGRFKDVCREELVAQLDQINGFMLMVTPYLPEPHKTRWLRDMVHLSHVMIREFYSEESGFFWGSIHDDSGARLGSRHTDFGHTIKALWMIDRVGQLAENASLIEFAAMRVPDVIFDAYDEEAGTWFSRLDRHGRAVRDREWWVHCELDQVAATWSLRDSSFSNYTTATYSFWDKHFVDKNNGGVWHMLTEAGGRQFPKAHLWKNGFHESEHALIAYITSQVLDDAPVVLYFAPRQELELPHMQPYLFSGKISSARQSALTEFPELKRVRAEFQSGSIENADCETCCGAITDACN